MAWSRKGSGPSFHSAYEPVPTEEQQRREADRDWHNAHYGFSSAGQCGKVITPPCPVRGCVDSRLLSAHNNILIHVPQCSEQRKWDTNHSRYKQEAGLFERYLLRSRLESSNLINKETKSSFMNVSMTVLNDYIYVLKEIEKSHFAWWILAPIDCELWYFLHDS